MNGELTDRIFGLDLLRSVAILIVVLVHSNLEYIRDFIPFPLPDGVDLFFVLSGYLIGMMLIKTAERHQAFDLKVAMNFLQRRWFRTLPNYFLFLFINMILVHFGLITGFLNKYALTYLVFFQNFYKPYDFLFWESWSLCVEEWFYLLFPVLLIVLFRLKIKGFKIKQMLFTAILLFLLFPLVYRLLQFHFHVNLDYDLYYRKLVLTRLDTIGVGLLGAFIHYYYQSIWNKLKQVSCLLGVASIILLTALNLEKGFFQSIFFNVLFAFSVLLIIPQLSSWKEEKIPFKPVRFISKISYSMYLIHVPLLELAAKYVPYSSKAGSVLFYIAYWMVLLCLSYLVYKLYEKPLMNLRESKQVKKFFNLPSN